MQNVTELCSGSSDDLTTRRLWIGNLDPNLTE